MSPIVIDRPYSFEQAQVAPAAATTTATATASAAAATTTASAASAGDASVLHAHFDCTDLSLCTEPATAPVTVSPPQVPRPVPVFGGQPLPLPLSPPQATAAQLPKQSPSGPDLPSLERIAELERRYAVPHDLARAHFFHLRRLKSTQEQLAKSQASEQALMSELSELRTFKETASAEISALRTRTQELASQSAQYHTQLQKCDVRP